MKPSSVALLTMVVLCVGTVFLQDRLFAPGEQAQLANELDVKRQRANHRFHLREAIVDELIEGRITLDEGAESFARICDEDREYIDSLQLDLKRMGNSAVDGLDVSRNALIRCIEIRLHTEPKRRDEVLERLRGKKQSG
jgi:hypothetical protein